MTRTMISACYLWLPFSHYITH